MDADGSVWVSRSVAEFVANPVVAGTCRRRASAGVPFSIRSDATADLRCTSRTAGSHDGASYVEGFLPSALADLDDPSTQRVLVPQRTLEGGTPENGTLDVIVRERGLLASYGLTGGPSWGARYWVTATRMGQDSSQFTGVDGRMGEFLLRRSDVPDLPASLRVRVG